MEVDTAVWGLEKGELEDLRIQHSNREFLVPHLALRSGELISVYILYRIHFPLAVLLASAVLAVLSALFFRTHSDLSNSIQPSPSQRISSSSSEAKGVERPFSQIKKVLNPFTLTVAGFGIGLFAAATVLPP